MILSTHLHCLFRITEESSSYEKNLSSYRNTIRNMYTNLKDFSARTVSAISSDRAVKVERHLEFYLFVCLIISILSHFSLQMYMLPMPMHYSIIHSLPFVIGAFYLVSRIKPSAVISPHLLVTGTEAELCEPAAPPQQHPQPRPQLTLRRRKQVQFYTWEIAVYIDIHIKTPFTGAYTLKESSIIINGLF